ncbi:leucine-rich repeat and calponin homology domain-containing protein 4 [Morone saxatilis]|uniref:leucine-rich repeat and calponin homology domain-containing protein 4 n=1 Tax=Morone saxatilis TaxID=34816 RepID=UPI0015E24008|nr:leucine-rich repeat and calponin homology domain-containing protein 4 [Morone saxatilis]
MSYSHTHNTPHRGDEVATQQEQRLKLARTGHTEAQVELTQKRQEGPGALREKVNRGAGAGKSQLWELEPISAHTEYWAYLSKNRLCELPEELCQFISLETLSLYHNGMRSLSSSLGNLQALTYLNLSRNLLSSLPPSVFQLPLLRVLIVSNNKLGSLPASIYSLTHLRQLDVSCNELQCLPAELGQLECLRDLNLRRNQLTTLPEECVLYMFPCSLSEQELFTGQFGGLDSGFNSVDSGSKRWSGNESADDFSERSLRMAEVSRDQRNLEEEDEEDGSPMEASKVNGAAEHTDFIDSIVTEEEEEIRIDPPTPTLTAPLENSSPPQDSTVCRTSLHIDVGPPTSAPSAPLSPSSPTLEERRRPGTLLIWQERERQHQQREKASLLKSSTKTGSHVAAAPPQTGSVSAGASPENNSQSGLRQRCASADQMSPTILHRSSSRIDVPSSPKTSPPPGQAQKPNSFLFRTSSRSNVKPAVFTLGESGRSESRTMLRSPKEERPDITQLRKTLESRLKITLPEDLGEALSNGTILCQLVNHIRPRSVSIIHIPSPAVPKLSSAKCRLNVENFIAACRKLGVPEMDVCVCSDVLLCKLPAVLRCVTALLAAEGGETAEDHSPRHSSPSPSSSSSPLSTDFLLFYCAVMALLYVLYCYLLT